MIDPKLFRQVRKALGLSQAQLADALGLSRVTVNKMERGRLARGIPDEVGAKLMALGKGPVTGIDLDWERPPEACSGDSNGPLDDAHLWDNEEDDQ